MKNGDGVTLPVKPCPRARKKTGRRARQCVAHPPHVWIAGVYIPVGDVDGYEAWCEGWPRTEVVDSGY